MMLRQYISVGKDNWGVIIYYNVGKANLGVVENSLRKLSCPEDDIKKALNVLKFKNTGVTYTNTVHQMSLVCIGQATDAGQFISTVVHEAKHVQSHICSYYGIEEDTEEAAYLIGYLVKQMFKTGVKTLLRYLNKSK